MAEGTPLPNLEPVKAETLEAIASAVDTKLNNPEVLRKDPTRGSFVIEDIDQDGHESNTELEVTRLEDGFYLRFIESFNESTPRSKPSVLVTDYDITLGAMVLLTGSERDHGPLAIAKLNQLESEGLPTTYESDDPNQKAFAASEKLAQVVLTAVQGMKIYIA